MTSKENNDPILAFNPKNMKNDILMFKNETLKDFKEAQRKVSEKYKILDFEIKEKLESFEQRIITYENKIIELSNLINTDKTIRDKVDALMEFKEKTDDAILTEKIRLDNIRNDLNSNVDRIDKILKDSVIYPGIIGGISRFKTFHELIDYVLTQCSQNLTFREKSILDFKGYKTKLENTIASFNTQTTSLLNSTSEYTKSCVKELEEKIKSIFNVYDDRLQDSRLENANYAVGLERATEALKKELQQLYVIKKELYEKVDNGMTEVKNDNTRVVKLFTGYKKNFHLMQHKFTQLSDFIKDIRFRVNLKEDVKRREFSHMSDLINFDKKKKPSFYEGVYDIDIIKKGFASQLKDYIEGRITADQLFKKKDDSKPVNKSASKLSKSTPLDIKARLRKSVSVSKKQDKMFGEEVKLNYIDLFKSAMFKRMSYEPEESKNIKNITKKETIKEEDDENINSSKELNSIFYKNIEEVKEDPLNKTVFVKDDNIKEDKKIEKKNIEKNDKIIKPKKEESKIQIVSRDVNKEKEKEKEKINNEINQKNAKPNIKNVISDLFSVKDIIDNIKDQNNEPPLNDKITIQSPKKKNDNSKINANTNNNNKFIDIKKDEVQNIKNIKPFNRPVTVTNIKKNNNNIIGQYQNKTNNLGIKTNNDLMFEQKSNRFISGKENKKVGNQDLKTVNVSIYNATINTLGDYIQTLNYKTNNNFNRKKANSTSKRNNKFYTKQNMVISAKKPSLGVRREDARAIENMFNNLTKYMPKNDINVDENSYLGLKKKK